MSIPFAGTEITKRGWQCPGCGRCYAPWVTMCASCPRTFPAIATACHPSGIEEDKWAKDDKRAEEDG